MACIVEADAEDLAGIEVTGSSSTSSKLRSGDASLAAVRSSSRRLRRDDVTQAGPAPLRARRQIDDAAVDGRAGLFAPAWRKLTNRIGTDPRVIAAASKDLLERFDAFDGARLRKCTIGGLGGLLKRQPLGHRDGARHAIEEGVDHQPSASLRVRPGPRRPGSRRRRRPLRRRRCSLLPAIPWRRWGYARCRRRSVRRCAPRPDGEAVACHELAASTSSARRR